MRINQNLRRNSGSWVRIAVCLAMCIALSGLAQNGANPTKSILLPEANRPPDANQQMEMREQQAKQQNYEAANSERKKQLVSDSDQLLKLATELKAEVDKTDKDTLSVTVIRKADAIERLAHNVKEKMKLTVGAS